MSTESRPSPAVVPGAAPSWPRRIDVDAFRDQMKRIGVSGEILAIEEAGQILGYFVPVKSTGSAAAQRARARLEQAIAEARAAGVFDEAALSAAFNLKEPA